MNNPLLAKLIEERKGHYCHCLEVSEVYEIETIIEAVIEGYPNYKEEDYIEFFETITVYSLNDDNEQAIYDFNFTDYIKDTI